MRKIFFLIVAAIVAFMWGDFSLEKISDLEFLSGKRNIVVMGCDIRKDDAGRSDTLFVVMMDKSVVVDFQGFKGLVDAVGGVDINVEKRMYYYDPYADFEIDLRPGNQHMDGKTAMQYVRYRDEEGDIGRIRRQQKFIMALYKQIASKNILAKMPGVSKQIMSMIKTDLSLKEMVELGKVMHDMMETDGLKMAMVPGTPKYVDGISYWIPDIPKMRQQMAEMQGVKMSEKFRENTKKLEQDYKNSPKK